MIDCKRNNNKHLQHFFQGFALVLPPLTDAFSDLKVSK